MNIVKLLKFFKKNNTLKEIKIKDIVFNNTKLCTFNDLFCALGADLEIKKLKEISKADTYHMDNLRMNQKTFDKIDNLLLTNLLSKKNKYARTYREKYLRTQHSFDSLIFAPRIDNSIQDDVLCIIKPGNSKYKAV